MKRMEALEGAFQASFAHGNPQEGEDVVFCESESGRGAHAHDVLGKKRHARLADGAPFAVPADVADYPVFDREP